MGVNPEVESAYELHSEWLTLHLLCFIRSFDSFLSQLAPDQLTK